MACRVISNLHKYAHVTPALKSLLWLKIDDRILYRVAMVYTCKPEAVAPYLIDLLPIHERGRQL